jgi:hypothetical protein
MSSNEAQETILESEQIESLRLILEKEQGHSVSCDEATEVGDSLLSFFELLGDDTDNALA